MMFSRFSNRGEGPSIEGNAPLRSFWAVLFAFVAVGLSWAGVPLRGAELPTKPGVSEAAAEALHELRGFVSTGRVLHIAAHPDDENTQLIAYLSRGRGYDTAYLSITRGDGGQNLLGAQLDEKLGVARTQELLAARRLDGGRQFFTRAIDFGFSKSHEETLSIWDHQQVLSDVVRIIRRFRPDVIVSRFPVPPGSGGHGHHTASGILALEAFKLAGDEKAFPEQLRDGLAAWQPKRIFWNRGGPQTAANEASPMLRIDISGSDPVTGEPFGVMAARSRAMHKTQGFGEFGGRGGSGPRLENFVLLAGESATKDLMDGVDSSWARIPGGAEVGRLAEQAVAAFSVDDPSASVPALLEIRRRLSALKSEVIVDEKRAQLDRVLVHCLGLTAASRANTPNVVPGETITLATTVRSTAAIPVRWLAVECAGERTSVNAELRPTQAVSRDVTYVVSRDARLSHPYWLRLPGTVGMSRVEDPNLIGLPENGASLPVSFAFEVGGQTLVVSGRGTYLEPGAGSRTSGPLSIDQEPEHPISIVPHVRLRFDAGAAIFRPGETRAVELEVTAARPKVSGTAELVVPTGWSASAAQTFSIDEKLGHRRLTFRVTAPERPAIGAIEAKAFVGGRAWSTDAIEIHYPHIPLQLLQPAARRKVVSVDVQTRGRTVGYIAGAGDDIPAALEQLGYQVRSLTGTELTPENLKSLDAVVVGVRAFNTRTDLEPGVAALHAYVEAGGTVVSQYNWARDLKVKQIAPYPLRLSNDRVTDENAAVTFLTSNHPVLTTPNRITAADFEGWVQERGVYFPNQWDDAFVPILAMNDPGEAPLRGSLLVARHGKGQYVYTGLAFFRQLPAGVPGAYRLFANLVSVGK